MNREAWHTAVHGVTKSQTWLSGWLNWTDIVQVISTWLAKGKISEQQPYLADLSEKLKYYVQWSRCLIELWNESKIRRKKGNLFQLILKAILYCVGKIKTMFKLHILLFDYSFYPEISCNQIFCLFWVNTFLWQIC